jgi:large subunit ribosomal protein L25
MELQAQLRDPAGTSATAARKAGRIPAELYGKGITNQHVTVEEKEFRRVLKEAGESTIVTLVVGKEKHPVIIHEIQRDPVHDTVQHVDLYQVRMDEKIRAHVPLKFEGEAPAVKEQGGVLNRSMDEIEVEALPGDMPHHIVVDLTPLAALDESIHVKDLPLGKGVRAVSDVDAVVASVAAFKEEPVEPVVAPSVEDVKVEGEEKRTEAEPEGEAKEKA